METFAMVMFGGECISSNFLQLWFRWQKSPHPTPHWPNRGKNLNWCLWYGNLCHGSVEQGIHDDIVLATGVAYPFLFSPDHRTLKFLKMKCNPTNKKQLWPMCPTTELMNLIKTNEFNQKKCKSTNACSFTDRGGPNTLYHKCNWTNTVM